MSTNLIGDGGKFRAFKMTALSALFLLQCSVSIQAAPLRRSISPDQPVWFVHIDTWNFADPQKIIELIPEDIRPFVVFNISMSISHDDDGWSKVDSGYETAKSWLRTCAENQVWAMVQPSSGGYSHFSDYDLSVYEDFFREYPNFLGFNYCEQFWGFNDPPLSPPWEDRVAHWAELLPLTAKYGGYLTVSWCGNQWSPSINPIAMLKRDPNFAAACEQYTENFILCEKYTQVSYQSDMESLCLGAYLSGYSGNYGIRYDSTGWTDSTQTGANFTMATAGAPHLEHVMLTGETVIDGPELIWAQNFYGGGTVSVDNGYLARRWYRFSQFDNMSIDLYRKILDGTVRIPTRQEVIDRTKVVVINDVNSGSNDDIYSSPTTLYQGLYRMDGDGNLADNKTFFKKTGRYPTIPVVFNLDDAPAQSFEVQVDKSSYNSRWPSIASKQAEFNSLFPQEYTGDIFAGRHENGWVIYNPYKTTNINGPAATGNIPFKFNTCDSMDLSLAQYSAGVVKETATNLTFYLNNYDSELGLGMRTDTIAIHGSTVQPTYSYTDRASHTASIVSSSWVGGVFTLTVTHNGPLDITINCAGTATGRETAYTPANIVVPAPPMPYTGPLQYEGEFFDHKNIQANRTDGDWQSPPPVTNYTGQGYLQFGTSSSAAVRDIVTVLNGGTYRLETRYSNPNGTVNTIDLYVNGAKVADLSFPQTASYSNWGVNVQNISLNAGANTIEFRAGATAPGSVYFDNFVIVPTAYGDGLVIEENQPGYIDVEGAIDTANAGYVGDGYADTDDASGAGVYWALDFDDSLPKSFTFRYAAATDLTANLIVDGSNVASNIRFPSTGSLSSWDYATIYPVVPAGESIVRLEAISDEGLPNIDSLEMFGATAWEWTPGTVPFVPVGLSATPASTTQVNLDWANTPGADTYTVKRATASGGPYSLVASGVVGSAFSDSGLSELTTYFYVVSAVNTTGESGDSAEVTATTQTLNPPSAPTGLVAVATSYNRIDLSWGSVLGADSYTIKRSIGSGGPYVTVAMGVSGTSFSDDDLYAATTFYYVISAVNAIGESADSAEAGTVTLSSGTLEPIEDAYVRDGGSADSNFGLDGDLVVKYDGGTGFNRNSFLKFDVNGLADALTIQLQLTPYQVDSGDTMNYELLLDDSWVETDVTWNNQPTDTGGVVATASSFVVGVTKTVTITTSAKNEASGDGILSLKLSKPVAGNNFVGFRSREYTINTSQRPKLACTFTHIDYPVPDAPTGLVATAASTNQINLSWTASSGAASYAIKRANMSGGPYALIAVGVQGTSFSDSGLIYGETYFYVVSAINGTGESADSAEATAMAYVQTYQESGGILSMEAENGVLGSRWLTGADAGASGGAYIEVDPAYNWTGSTPESTASEAVVSYDFSIATGGNYGFWFRMYTDGGAGSDDSFFWRIDNGSWNQENNRAGLGSWFSTDNSQVDSLGAGSHTLQIAYRENGTRLDKFVMQLDSVAAPTGNGPAESIPPPPAPTGLAAAANSSFQIDLSWVTASGADSYIVKRSTSSGAPYEIVVSNIVAATYSDISGLSAGTRYYYVVSAVNAGGESGDSGEDSAVPSDPVSQAEYHIAAHAVTGGTNLSMVVSNSVPGHDYWLLTTEDLMVPDWQPADTAQGGTGSDLAFDMPITGVESNRYFKLDVQRQ